MIKNLFLKLDKLKDEGIIPEDTWALAGSIIDNFVWFKEEPQIKLFGGAEGNPHHVVFEWEPTKDIQTFYIKTRNNNTFTVVFRSTSDSITLLVNSRELDLTMRLVHKLYQKALGRRTVKPSNHNHPISDWPRSLKIGQEFDFCCLKCSIGLRACYNNSLQCFICGAEYHFSEFGGEVKFYTEFDDDRFFLENPT